MTSSSRTKPLTKNYCPEQFPQTDWTVFGNELYFLKFNFSFLRLALSLTAFFILSNIGFSQTYNFQVESKNAVDVLEALAKKLDVKFNFSHDHLPEGFYSFSCAGNKDKILKITFSALDRNYVPLDQNIYTVQPIPIEESNKVNPLELTGWVKDEFGQALNGATIGINSLQKIALSETDGSFKMKGYLARSEVLEIRFVGYETAVMRIRDFLKLSNRTVILKTKTHQLRDVEILENPSWFMQNFTNTDVLRLHKMPPPAGTTDRDALTAIQLLPGVSTASENISEIQIRGGLPDQTKYQWNGIQLFQTSHFFGKISSTNPFMVDQIQVNRNGASAKDGGQASGTINISDDLKTDSLSIKTHLDYLYANVGLRAPLLNKKLQVSTAFRHSYFGIYKNNIFEKFFRQTFQSGRISDEEYFLDVSNANDFIRLVPKVRFRDFSISANYQPTEKDKFKISTLSYNSRFVYLKEAKGLNYTPSDTLGISNKGYSAAYTRNWSPLASSELSWSKSIYKNDYRYIERPDSIAIGQEVDQFNNISQSTFRLNNEYSFKNISLNYGYQFENWDFESFHFERDEFASYNFYDDGGKAREHSLFAQALYTGSSYWQVEGGLRWSKYNRAFRKLLEPRIHLSFFPSSQWTIHAHYGEFHQVLNQVNVFTPLSIEGRYWYLASEENDLINETPITENRQLSMGARYSQKNWSATLDLYKKKIFGANMSAFDFTAEENLFRLTEMDIFGIEAAFQYNNDWLSMLWTYEYMNDDFTVPSLNLSYPSPYTQPHKLSLFQSVSYKQFECSLLWRFATGRPYSQPSDLESFVDGAGVQRYRLLYGDLLTERESNYRTVDFTFLYHLPLRQHSKISGQVGFSLINLFNRRNIVKNYYFVNDREMPFTAERLERRGLPFTPNVSIEIYFE